MRFEERELKPYVEPVLANELQEGSVYFSVTFVDDNMFIPIMETCVFVGKNDNGILHFQDVESYLEGIRYDSADYDNPATFLQCTENQLNNIFEFEHALDNLMCCSLRRRKSGLGDAQKAPG